jgi:hypothetical protein
LVRWTPQLSAGRWRYQLHDEAFVALARDTAGQRVPVRSSATYTLALEQTGDSLSLLGAIDTFAVVTDSRMAQPPRQGGHLRFTGVLSAHGRVGAFRGGAVTSCSAGVDPLIAHAQELFVQLPPTITPGTRWQDTVETTTCRGDMPVTATTVRSFRAVEPASWNQLSAIRVEQSSATTIRGNGTTSEAARSMSVAGQGSGSGTLLLHPTTGMVLSARLTSHTSLDVTTARGSFPFTQDLTTTIELHPTP